MRKTKVLLVLLVVLSMLTCSLSNVSARTIECYQSTESISPRLAYFSTVFSNITKGSGKIVCQGDYTSLANGIDVTLIVALERSTSTSWNQVASWSKTFSPGKGGNVVSGTYKNPPSGYYRTLTTALAKNSKGIILETVKVYSRTIKY